MKTMLMGAALVSVAGPVGAGEISTELKARLQSAMISYTDSIMVDGAYKYIDTEANALRTVYPANVHPMVLPFGGDYFVCSEMINAEGKAVTADYLVRLIGDDYRVVQLIVDDRESVEATMAKLEN